MSSLPDDFSHSKLKDRNWKGEKIKVKKSKIARTPTEKGGRCTDVLYSLIFLAFMVGIFWFAWPLKQMSHHVIIKYLMKKTVMKKIKKSVM